MYIATEVGAAIQFIQGTVRISQIKDSKLFISYVDTYRAYCK